MCLGLPGRIVASDRAGGAAEVEVAGVVRRIDMRLLDRSWPVGDWVLIHSGLALEPMSTEAARDAVALLGGGGAPH